MVIPPGYETCYVSCRHLMTTVRTWWYRLRYETCSISCHHPMATNRAWLLLPKVWNKLRQLSSSHDNSQSMAIPPSGMQNALSVSSAHDNGNSIVTPTSPPPQIWNMLRSEHADIRLRYKTCFISCLCLMITIRTLFWSQTRYISCHHRMTTVRAWWYPPQVCNMLRQLLSSHKYRQSTVIYP